MDKDPLFVSFFSDNGGYKERAETLKASLEKFGLRHSIFQAESTDSWLNGIRMKPHFILDCLTAERGTVIWIDADAEIIKRPELLFGEHDFAIYNWHADKHHHLAGLIVRSDDILRASGGVIKFGYTAPAMELLIRWVNAVQKNEKLEDDHCLDLAWNTTRPKVNPLWLSKSYNRMDSLWPEVDPVIDHHYTAGKIREEIACG